MVREFGSEDYDAHYFGHKVDGKISNYRKPYNSPGLKKTLRMGLWAAHINLELSCKPGFSPKRILDLGGATGVLSDAINKHTDLEAYNLDLSTWATQNSVQEMQGKTVQGSVKAIPFTDGSFDGVVSLDVLEHIPTSDILNVGEEIFRVLVPGGRGVIVINNGVFGDFENDLSHINKHPTDWWRSRLEMAGFEIGKPAFHFLQPLFACVPKVAQKITAVHPGLIIIDKPNQKLA